MEIEPVNTIVHFQCINTVPSGTVAERIIESCIDLLNILCSLYDYVSVYFCGAPYGFTLLKFILRRLLFGFTSLSLSLCIFCSFTV